LECNGHSVIRQDTTHYKYDKYQHKTCVKEWLGDGKMKTWDWSDYGLLGSPTISFDDYRIRAFGRENEITETINELATYSKKSTRVLRKLVAYWGSGKSTYLYNICYNTNKRLFFEDEIERPNEGLYTHMLAFFQKGPAKRARLLENVYNDGLPWIWDASTSKQQATEKGQDAWKEALRKMAFIILRRSTNEINKRHLEEAVLGGSKMRKTIYQSILDLKEEKTSSFIKKIDEMQKGSDQTYEECGEIMRFYFRMLLPSIEIKKGNKKVVSQDAIEQFFPQFLWDTFSSKFLVAYKELLSGQDMNLRYFPAFERLLRAGQTNLLLVFDEVEDWSWVVQNKIDDDLHDIVVDAESPMSVVLIFRTEVLRKIRSDTTLGTFMTIYDRLESMQLPQIDKNGIISLTEAILGTAREDQTTLFPLTEAFVEKLSSRTKRGKAFNVRTYLRALKKVLETSREWKRDKPELTDDLLEQKKVEEIINEAIKAEEAEAFKFAGTAPKQFEE
jgi:hypothetical protein